MSTGDKISLPQLLDLSKRDSAYYTREKMRTTVSNIKFFVCLSRHMQFINKLIPLLLLSFFFFQVYITTNRILTNYSVPFHSLTHELIVRNRIQERM